MPPLKKKNKILFFSVKGKLSTFVPHSEHRDKIEADVLAAHEAVKLALFSSKLSAFTEEVFLISTTPVWWRASIG